ncbi:MAG: cryptochrome/photolyase family protein, partial [Candidatus Poseidoniaceae archaeon]
MSVFTSALSGTCAGVDTWHFVSYDQLSHDLLPENKDVGLIFIETSWKAKQLPYHKQKLALLLSNQRHFALEMQDAGYSVRYTFSEKEYGEVLSELGDELGEITATKPAELSLRRSIQPLVDS